MVKILRFVFIVVNRFFVLTSLGIMRTIGIHVWFLSNKASELLLIETKLVLLFDLIIIYILPADGKNCSISAKSQANRN